MSRPTSAGSDKSTGSAGSKESADSYTSTLSTDSYVTTLKPKLDEEFKQMLNEIRLADTNRTIAKERKIQSHEVKKRDPTDTERRTDWTPEMEAEHAQYKLTVKALERAKKVQDESEKLAKASKTADPATQERVRMQALRDDEAWLDAAIAAATARLNFLRHKNAFSTPSHKNHIIACQDNLNSAKDALREIKVQRAKIENIQKIQAAKAAAAARVAAKGGPVKK